MSLSNNFYCLLALGLLALASGCARQGSAADAGKARQGSSSPAADDSRPPSGEGPGGGSQGVPVEVEYAAIGPVAAFLSYNTTLEVETSVIVYPEVGGLVETILVEEGDRVKAGQALIELEHDELEVDLRESEADVRQLETSFARSSELFKRGLVNRNDFDTSTFELNRAKLQLERARLRVKQATVRAPVDGVITERFVQPGARIGASAQLFGLMSLDDMIARVHVPGRYLTAVQEGQEAYLTSEFLSERTFPGWIKRIRPIVDPASGTFKVTVGVHPGTETPPPGLFVNVRIVTDRRDAAMLVPKRAVLYEGGERFIFVVRDGKASKLRLKAGFEEGNFVEAMEDVAAGDAIVVLGQNALKDAAPVRIVNGAGPSAAVATPATANKAAATTAAAGY